jgi:hypothetical protein
MLQLCRSNTHACTQTHKDTQMYIYYDKLRTKISFDAGDLDQSHAIYVCIHIADDQTCVRMHSYC